MRKNSLKALVIIFAVLMFSVNVFAANNKSWYCKRNSDHKQPIADADMQFVENYDGFYIDHKHGDTCVEKVVYLTFDAGYENGNVERILDVLQEKKVNGAFFILGNLVKNHLPLVKRMAEDGHIVCNHTNNHPDMTKKQTFEEFQEEIISLETLYEVNTGRKISKFFRPPEGRFNVKTLEFAKELGYKTIFWSLAYADWDNNAQMSCEAAKAKILDNIHNGAIILLHPTSTTNAEILGDIIDELRLQGYRFGTLDELTEV